MNKTLSAIKHSESHLRKPPFENMASIPGGTSIMGSNEHYPEEAPAHNATKPSEDES